MNNPSKAEKTRLIKAYADKIYSAKLDVPLKTQQRLHEAFERTYTTLSNKYPHIDWHSSNFYTGLEQRAKLDWENRLMKGAGTTW